MELYVIFLNHNLYSEMPYIIRIIKIVKLFYFQLNNEIWNTLRFFLLKISKIFDIVRNPILL